MDCLEEDEIRRNDRSSSSVDSFPEFSSELDSKEYTYLTPGLSTSVNGY